MVKVFLSHSSRDKSFVRMLASDLALAEVGVWIDELEIGPGDSILRRISEGLSTSSFVVACLSPGSVGSPWVQQELEIAMTTQIETQTVIVLPILIGAIQKGDLPLYLRPHLYLDFRAATLYDGSFRRLAQKIDSAVNAENTLKVDDNRRGFLVDMAQNADMREWVLDYLIGSALAKPDPSERHWGYIALGQVGGPRACDALRNGLQEKNAFARKGAELALDRLKRIS
jgi:hypothetical protein